ncbi:XPG I-region [Dictyocaulus viviparus]|uniref:Exonuclease 1 n=1 Tax=Dictyocaulus viviparus TaxID=29172 RepID=A0A0D8XPB9_DICVI|nr:XPG I-region [Dictyocaulus viviparus]
MLVVSNFQGNIREFSKCSVAVDVSCLLHKGLFGGMESVAQGKKSTFYIYYVNKHIKALLDLGCHVIMVFDGRALPAKKDLNEERRQRRVDNVKAGEVLLSEGKIDEAVDKFKRATSITLEYFRNRPNVDVIVSPYESDAQLTFLVNEGFADLVITEDSDLIVFGCTRVAFKWNCESGNCVIYEKSQLAQCFSGVMRNNFDFTKFRRICILSGCDYLQAGLPGIGLNKALSFFSKTSKTNLNELLPRIPTYLNMPKLNVTKEFISDFIRAENTFIYQVVFDPRQRCQRPLTKYLCPLKDKGKISISHLFGDDDDSQIMGMDFSYAGQVISSTLAVRLALGNQIENSVMTDKFFLPSPIPEWSVWFDRFESCGNRKRRIEEEQKEAEKKCGMAFQFDSPSKKRLKLESFQPLDSIDVGHEVQFPDYSVRNEMGTEVCAKQEHELFEDVQIDQNLSQTHRTQEYPVGKVKSVSRSNPVKNQASINWNVEKLIETYASKTDFDSSKNSNVTSTASGRSAYFVHRSPSCANPFRRPVVKKVGVASTSDVDLQTHSPPVSSVVKEEYESSPLRTSSVINVVGCRPSGLRASFKK